MRSTLRRVGVEYPPYGRIRFRHTVHYLMPLCRATIKLMPDYKAMHFNDPDFPD